VEVDYDCPSRQLLAYATFIRRLKATLPRETSLSITALPTWIGAYGLNDLLTAVDASVLQVHSVQDPRRGLADEAQDRIVWATYMLARAHSLRNRPGDDELAKADTTCPYEGDKDCGALWGAPGR
jgi:Protein of unknown function (DUF3142)